MRPTCWDWLGSGGKWSRGAFKLQNAAFKDARSAPRPATAVHLSNGRAAFKLTCDETARTTRYMEVSRVSMVPAGFWCRSLVTDVLWKQKWRLGPTRYRERDREREREEGGGRERERRERGGRQVDTHRRGQTGRQVRQDPPAPEPNSHRAAARLSRLLVPRLPETLSTPPPLPSNARTHAHRCTHTHTHTAAVSLVS